MLAGHSGNRVLRFSGERAIGTRQHVGYDRLVNDTECALLRELYKQLRLFINFFQPSQKLLLKERNGAKVKKQYDTAKTPYQRLIAEATLSEEDAKAIKDQYESINIAKLKPLIAKAKIRLWKEAKVRYSIEATKEIK